MNRDIDRHVHTNIISNTGVSQLQNQDIDNNNNIININDNEQEFHRTVFDLNICSLNVQGLAKYEGDVHFQDYCKQFEYGYSKCPLKRFTC